MKSVLRTLLFLLAAAGAAAQSTSPDLLAAVRSGELAQVQAALDAGAPVNATDDWGRTALMAATQLRNTAAVKLLIARGADVNAANRNDITPLIAAAQNGNRDIARALLEAGADAARRDNLGWTALQWARARRDEAMAALLDAAPATAPAAPALTPPPRRGLDPAVDPARIVRGRPDAPLTIYEYTDFQCPYCARGARVMDEVLARYEGRARLVVKHLPLPQLHPMALPAAHYFEAIALQDAGKAWDFYDRVFRNQALLKGGEPALREVAAGLGLDLARLERDVASEAVRARVAADMAESRRLRFDGVPAFVIDGQAIEGAQPLERFVEVIDAALARR